MEGKKMKRRPWQPPMTNLLNKWLMKWLMKDPEFRKGSLWGKIWMDCRWDDLE
jgi:hypothetical protein